MSKDWNLLGEHLIRTLPADLNQRLQTLNAFASVCPTDQPIRDSVMQLADALNRHALLQQEFIAIAGSKTGDGE